MKVEIDREEYERLQAAAQRWGDLEQHRIGVEPCGRHWKAEPDGSRDEYMMGTSPEEAVARLLERMQKLAKAA
jgi:hypothetical protein